ncbi:exonuclease V subunit gamma [Photobacterium jeanii]|uniref:RecBCD enzyme subunit RecC n=1 Tax=Photobacterium jeanii TaxID=858640 RepID=A0A178K9M2_9GAMM|nr:exodeoxyribonuclease V subunit gamma [Photobacterium jeanii]OAN14038.1 exonuclease V subunit gamma [Photobacterium jeanii]PST86949.1 exodeoxyribonuclease V subunit gamma [Photobacterium jeanii]
MFTVYHSNQLDMLKSLLVELIRLQPLDNPFEQEQILVQSPGMSQWLKLELAKSFGVAANITFPLPATFIWTMFTKVLSDVPERSAFNKEAMTWKLMEVLPTQLALEEFEPLRRYLEGDEDGLKIYQLAEKIADIFDQYLVYRPEWIQQWEAGETVAELGDEHPWQPMLWQALYDHTLSLGQSPYHRANLYEHFIETLENYAQTSGTLPEGLPKRLFVFGISSLPPRYMDALAALGEHIDVHLMFTNPCRYYWGEVRDRKYLARLAAKRRLQVKWLDDHSEHGDLTDQLKGSIEDNVIDEMHTDAVGNSLLASMGKLGRDNLFLLSEMEANEIEAFVDIEPDTLLHSIQADILNLDDRQNDDILDSSHHKLTIQPDDHSLSIQACHSPMREVEVLHDKLLAMFDADSSLKPRDVIVMVSDINAYSPAIQAVFGNAPGNRYIPFSISDRTAEQENPILLAFLRLLTLPESRCQASELLELLEVPAVMAKFGFDSQSFDKVKRWIEEVGVRWGLDSHTASQFDLPPQQQNTWLFGIQRMLLGYAMPYEAGLFDGISAYDEVQGLDAELAGQLASFIDKLVDYRHGLAQAQSVADWTATLNQLLDDFFAVELEGELVLKSIRDCLHRLQEQLDDANYRALISPQVLTEYLTSKLSGERVSQRFLAGQVNFCTLMPMRSIPFNVVCLLGMNDGAYPRSMPAEGFDLMDGRTKAGDRSRRDDDRYLFLEAVQSAQQTLYISYVGRSIQDNTEKVPSVLVSELVEYCQQGYCLAGDEALAVDQSADKLKAHLFHHHALVPFSPSAFRGQFASYAAEWLPAAERQGQAASAFQLTALESEPLPDDKVLELDLAELQRFWRLPVRYFFNRRLKVYFEPPMAVTEDDEPFTLNGLDGYQMREQLLQQLLDAKLTNADEEQVFTLFAAQQKAAGRLPVGAFGDLDLAATRSEVETISEDIYPLIHAPLADHEVDLTFQYQGHTVKLQGWLKQYYQSGLVRYRSGKVRSQDLLTAWFDHLCLAASANGSGADSGKVSHVIGNGEHRRLLAIDAEQAKQYLQEAIELYFDGLNQPLPYFPKTALAGIQAHFDRKGNWLDDDETEQKALKKMADTFNDGYLFAGEGADSYIARVWPMWDENLATDAARLASRILQAAVINSESVEKE